VVGHSFGGRVAIPLQAMVPDRIERMVLTGVPLLDREGRRSRPATAYRLVRRLHRMGVVGDERMEAMRNRYGSADYRSTWCGARTTPRCPSRWPLGPGRSFPRPH
jgi:pimeloyl-ACP methyl ester carboxylesterase